MTQFEGIFCLCMFHSLANMHNAATVTKWAQREGMYSKQIVKINPKHTVLKLVCTKEAEDADKRFMSKVVEKGTPLDT